MVDDTKTRFFPLILCLGIIVLIVYSNTLHAPFLFDDRPYILDDPAIRMTELSWESIKTAAFESVPKRRYLSNISFALNHYAGAYNEIGYHLVNLVIHILNGVLLFFLVNTTLSRLNLKPGSKALEQISPVTVAFAASLLWLVFPVNTGAVTYIVQRMASLAALFYILSIWLYVLGRISQQNGSHHLKSIAFFSGCGVAGICAVLTKQNTATLPLMILLYEWFFFQDLKISFSKSRILWAMAAAAVFVAVAYHYTDGNPLQRIMNSYAVRDFTLPERVMTEWRVIIYYISLFFWPSPGRLNLDHGFPLSSTPAEPVTTLLSMIALVATAVLAIYSTRRHRLISFCILWYLINLVIESSVIGLEIIYEHRTYLPFMMFFPVFVLIILKFIQKPRVPLALLSAIVMLFSIWTWQRNAIWENPISFWQDNLSKSPQNPRPHLNLGNYMAQEGNNEQAIVHFKAALALDPHRKIRVLVYNGLANALAQSGQFGEAVLHYYKALAIFPNYGIARANLQRVSDAIAKSPEYRSNVFKQQMLTYYKTGRQLREEGKYGEAILQLQTALVYEPNFIPGLYNLALSQALVGRFNDSISSFEQLVALQPDNSLYYYNVACLYSLQDEKETAVAWLKKAVALGYDNWDYIIKDDDLKNIRDLPEVKSIIDKNT